MMFFATSESSIVILILSVISKPLSLRKVWICFTSSLAWPSMRRFSEISRSRATVRAPSFATAYPGMSSFTTSTSSRLMVTFWSRMLNETTPSLSNLRMSSCDISFTAWAISFISLPYFFPRIRKFGCTRFFKRLSSSTNSNSFTLTSSRISLATSSICFLVSLFLDAGIVIFWRGWRTIIDSFLRSERTMEVIFCAISIRSSSSLSITESFTLGNSDKCTLSHKSFPVTLARLL